MILTSMEAADAASTKSLKEQETMMNTAESAHKYTQFTAQIGTKGKNWWLTHSNVNIYAHTLHIITYTGAHTSTHAHTHTVTRTHNVPVLHVAEEVVVLSLCAAAVHQVIKVQIPLRPLFSFCLQDKYGKNIQATQVWDCSFVHGQGRVPKQQTQSSVGRGLS